MGDPFRLPRPKTRDVVLFRAGEAVFKGAELLPELEGYDRLTAEQLERDILPRVKERRGVIDAWMDGDALVARVRVSRK